jgi:type III secretion protein J
MKTLHRLPRWFFALLLAIPLAACKVGLYSGLTEHEANEMVAALVARQIDAAKERLDGADWQVQVPEHQLGAALDTLRAQGLPRDRFTSMGELFQQRGLVSTPAEERMRYIHAVSQELSQTLRSVDGVISARVHVVIPASDPMSDKVRPSSAAVFIKHRPDVDLRLLAPTVKDLVAHGIEGLKYDQVSLSLFPAQAAAPYVPPTPAAGGDALFFGFLTRQGVFIVLVLLLLAALCLMALPGLLRRQGVDGRAWFQRQVLRRPAR